MLLTAVSRNDHLDMLYSENWQQFQDWCMTDFWHQLHCLHCKDTYSALASKHNLPTTPKHVYILNSTNFIDTPCHSSLAFAYPSFWPHPGSPLAFHPSPLWLPQHQLFMQNDSSSSSPLMPLFSLKQSGEDELLPACGSNSKEQTSFISALISLYVSTPFHNYIIAVILPSSWSTFNLLCWLIFITSL